MIKVEIQNITKELRALSIERHIKHIDHATIHHLSNGPVVSNNKLFRKIKVEGSAYIPQGRSVELRALEEIEMDPGNISDKDIVEYTKTN